MNSSSSDSRSEGFFAGKGFYIVLFLCAAVIGVSAWVMAAGNRTMEKTDTVEVMRTEQETEAEAVIAPSSGRDMLIDETQFAPPEIVTEQLAEPFIRQPFKILVVFFVDNKSVSFRHIGYLTFTNTNTSTYTTH